MPTDAVDDVIGARLREAGQRYTTGRRALVERLRSAGQPLTIPELLRHLDVPQSTAYRNLAVLEQAGVVHRIVTTGDFARYELTEDLTEHHHHLICSSCGRVEDFTASRSFERSLDRAVSAVASASGFAAAEHRLDIVGTCRDCA
jgi:Fe2+ or Zn2+ uptake regulation protein